MESVYVQKNGSEVKFKIGRTKRSIKLRGRELQTGNPYPLSTADSIPTQYSSKCEKYLKGLLASRKCRGGGKEFYEIPREELADAVDFVRAWSDRMEFPLNQIEQLKALHPNGEMIEPSTNDRDMCERLLQLQEQETKIKMEREELECCLKLHIGECDGINGFATWKLSTREDIDRERFRQDHPDLYKRYSRQQSFRRFKLL